MHKCGIAIAPRDPDRAVPVGVLAPQKVMLGIPFSRFVPAILRIL